MAHPLAPLTTPAPALGHAHALLARLDECLALGFGRLGAEQHAALAALARAASATPLSPHLQEALPALRRSEFLERHFATLAATRAAVQGACYQALRAQVLSALGRPAQDDRAPALSAAAPPASTGLLESARHWLMEIAIAGFRQLEPETLLPFMTTLEKLQADPAQFRLAALLTGFIDELLAAVPMAALPVLPGYRWADLWTRAMLLAVRPPPQAAGSAVSGDLRLLGADVRQHSAAVSVVAYGLLEQAGTARLVRVTRSAYKVDVVLGRDQLRLLAAPLLLQGLAEPVSLRIDDMTLQGSGDLVWDERRAKAGGRFDLMALAKVFAPGAAAPQQPLLCGQDRHPAQLAEPVYLEGAQPLPIDDVRLCAEAELLPEKIAKAQRLLGLIRFDGGRFTLQPLAVQAGKDLAVAGANPASVARTPGKGDAVSILRERAGKLLRAKA